MMATDHGDVDPGAGAGAGAGAADPDRISGLPDHLLHDILIRLPGTADAARTSMLSRRWRRVWAHAPVISLAYKYRGEFKAGCPGGHVPDRVDAALAAHAAGTGATTSTVSLSRLEINLPLDSWTHLRKDRVAAWLHVAAQRLAGELRITLPPFFCRGSAKDGEVLLPQCERATSISLDLSNRTLRFGDGGGVFKALATLTIRHACLHGRELEAAVSSSRCPCLKKLVIDWIRLKEDDGDGACDLSIRSDSLELLDISYAPALRVDGRLRVHAPNLETFHSCISCDLCVFAPKLSEVRWSSSDHAFDSSRHHLASAGHQLRRLEVEADSSGFALMRQFNMVDELHLTVNLTRGVEEYERFLKCTDTLARCKVFFVKFMEMQHGFQPAMLHLLRKCAGIRRLVVQLRNSVENSYRYPCKVSSGCPCSRLENCKTQNVVLDSLEEVVITDPGFDDHKAELVRLLCRCSTRFHKKVAITVLHSGHIDYLHNKILSICTPNNRTGIAIQQCTRNGTLGPYHTVVNPI